MNAAQVTSSINNLIIGKIYIDHGGIMRIRSNLGLVAKLKFHETGMLTREAHLVCFRAFGAMREYRISHPNAHPMTSAVQAGVKCNIIVL